MLVCSVSLRAPRRAITADIAEAAEAIDATTTGFVVFATLVDDPANVIDTVDAYLGEIMVEAASASDTIDVGLAYAGEISEAIAAIESVDGVVLGIPVTWNPSDKSASITLSNGNLTASYVSGALPGVRATSGHSSGKYYWEMKWDAAVSGWMGLGKAAAAFSGSNNIVGPNVAGSVFLNGSSTIPSGNVSIGSSNSTICIAVDLTNKLIWFRCGAAGSWNATSGTAKDPATGVGGIDFTVIAGGNLHPVFIPALGTTTVTGNFGATSFIGTPPSGYNSGWPS